MPRSLIHIIWFVVLLGYASAVYFLSLPAHLPVWVTLLLVGVGGYFGLRWLLRYAPQEQATPMAKGDTRRAYAVLAIGLAVIIEKGYRLETQYGYWDAWWLWNHHSKYLQDPVYWRELFTLNDPYHPDYPLFLSSLIAFVWRLMGSFDHAVPYIFSMLIAMLVPTIIFLALYRKNLPVASIAFMLVALNTEYLTMALSMYADQPLAFLFLGAFVCVEYAKDSKQMVAVVAALLGCCIWMKNEGMLLALVFAAFYAKTLFSKGSWKQFVAGIALPLIAYCFLKVNAPANDLVKGQGGSSVERLMDVNRYVAICKYFYAVFVGPLLYVSIVVLLYMVYCFISRQWPGRNLLIGMVCILGFGFVYVLTPQELDWHLNTSAGRVIYQVVPAMVYAMARNCCNLRVFTDAEQFL